MNNNNNFDILEKMKYSKVIDIIQNLEFKIAVVTENKDKYQEGYKKIEVSPYYVNKKDAKYKVYMLIDMRGNNS